MSKTKSPPKKSKNSELTILQEHLQAQNIAQTQ
jgi:hypothetical protein